MSIDINIYRRQQKKISTIIILFANFIKTNILCRALMQDYKIELF
jgi:hypothetical protein